jgi:hypothetical protein
MIRIDKNIAAKSPVYKMERKAFIKMNVEQNQRCVHVSNSRNQSFISSYILMEEILLTQISTVIS